MKKELTYITPICIVIGVETEGILCDSIRKAQTSETFEEYTPEW